MQSFVLSNLEIDNQNVFQFGNNPERYLFALEIADEVFCNCIARKAYRFFYDGVLSSIEEDFSDCPSERGRINSLRYDMTRYLEGLKPYGKKITDGSFRYKVRGFVANFNYFVDTCCSILISLGKKIDKNDYFVDDEHIILSCEQYGDAGIYGVRKREQEKIIDSCGKDVAKYFKYLCIAEEIYKMEGENLSEEIKKKIAFVRYEWEYSTLLPVREAYSFINSSLDEIYSLYKDICLKYEIVSEPEDFFQGRYPESRDDIFKYRMPFNFYKNVYGNLSNEKKVELQVLSAEAYFSGDGRRLMEKFEGHEDNFNGKEIDYGDLRQVFYQFMVKGYYPPVFSFECFFDDENNIQMREKFYEDRLDRDLFKFKSVGGFLSIYDCGRAFEEKEEPEKEKKEEPLLAENEEELSRLIARIKGLISEYAGKEYIPVCDINRLTHAILGIEENIKEHLKENNGKFTYSFFYKTKDALIRMEEENRVAFFGYKNKFSKEGKIEFSDSTDEEDFGDNIDSNVAKICEDSPVFDTEIFDSSGNEISQAMETKKTGVKKIISEKYISDLKRIRAFVKDNSTNQELVLLVRDAEKILDIATKGYQHNECLQSSFDWFEKNEPNVIDAIDYFLHLKKVPASYKMS